MGDKEQKCKGQETVEWKKQTFLDTDDKNIVPNRSEPDLNGGYPLPTADESIISETDYISMVNAIIGSTPYRTPECIDLKYTYCDNEVDGTAISGNESATNNAGTGTLESFKHSNGMRRKKIASCVPIKECYEEIKDKPDITTCILITVLICIALAIGIIILTRKVRRNKQNSESTASTTADGRRK